MEVETQNINVSACRFYARQGCVLSAVNRFAYPELPDEVQLIWRKDLSSCSTVRLTLVKAKGLTGGDAV